MVSVSVVEDLDEVKHIGLGLFAGGENAAVDQIEFEGTAEIKPSLFPNSTKS